MEIDQNTTTHCHICKRKVFKAPYARIPATFPPSLQAGIHYPLCSKKCLETWATKEDVMFKHLDKGED